MGKNNDLILEIHGQDTDQLSNGTMGHSAVLHGAVQRFPSHLKDAVFTVQVGKVLKPLLVLFQFRQLDIISHGGSHNNDLLIKLNSLSIWTKFLFRLIEQHRYDDRKQTCQ